MDSSQKHVRFDALDGVRTLAVLAVFIYHVSRPMVRGGSVGVDVFFTLSGLVITLLLLRERGASGKVRLGRFYLNRIARLWPALLLACAVVAIFMRDEAINAFRSAVHIMNFTRGGWFGDDTTGGALGHTWSLAVEEQFYLIWPLLLIGLLRILTLKQTFIATLALAALTSVLRGTLEASGSGYERLYNGPDTRFDQLLLGCALAMALVLSAGRVERLARHLVWPALAFLAGHTLLVGYPREDDLFGIVYRIVGPLLVAVASAALFAGLITNGGHIASRVLGNRLLSWPGKHLSYGFYLWHFPIVYVLRDAIDAPLLRLVAAFLLTATVAFLSSRIMEEPIRRLIRAKTADRPATSGRRREQLAR